MVAEDYIAQNNTYGIERAKTVSTDWGIPILAADRSQVDGTPLTEAQRLAYITGALSNGFLGMRAARSVSRGPTWVSWLGYIKWASWPRSYVAGLFDRPNTEPPVRRS